MYDPNEDNSINGSDTRNDINDDNNINNGVTDMNSVSDTGPQSGPDKEDTSYADARYIPTDEIPATPRTYVSYDRPVVQEKEKRRGMGFGKVVALCLVCAILGGFAGTVAAGYIWDKTGDSEPLASDVLPSDNTISSPSETANPVSTVSENGSILSGAEIYTLGCAQTVGITTEITTANVFGQTTSASVSGSGIIVSEDGYIVTNYHVIKEAYLGGYETSVMLWSGETFVATIVGTEESNDVAVLKIDAVGLSATTFGNSEDMQVGETVYAIGNPLGELSYTMTSGMVSALDREITTGDSYSNTTINMFQIDAAVNSGNSGGPVYNDRGQVIGMVTAKYSSTGVEGIGFAIPIGDVSNIVRELIENGYVSGKASFGIKVTTVSSSVAEYYNMVEGAYVNSINTGSCAEEAGIQVGDIITGIDGKEVKSSSDLVASKKQYTAGDTALLTVYRAGSYINLSITFDEEIPAENDSSDASNDLQNQIPETPILPGR